jgi:peroxiredoxin
MSTAQTDPLPADLPVPVEDGAAAHLPGLRLPAIALRATDGGSVVLADLPGRTVVYVYPRTAPPDERVPARWNAIPGARGCTPMSCGFRDASEEFARFGVRVFGLSAQDCEFQREVVGRLHLPYPLLSDAEGALARALDLPTVEFGGSVLLKRMTLVLRDGVVEHVLYPVFPPDRAAVEALEWLAGHP